MNFNVGVNTGFISPWEGDHAEGTVWVQSPKASLLLSLGFAAKGAERGNAEAFRRVGAEIQVWKEGAADSSTTWALLCCSAGSCLGLFQIAPLRMEGWGLRFTSHHLCDVINSSVC